jgi:hypothetical protein
MPEGQIGRRTAWRVGARLQPDLSASVRRSELDATKDSRIAVRLYMPPGCVGRVAAGAMIGRRGP